MDKFLIKNLWVSFYRDEAAATSIEYALIASLIAVVIITSIALVGENTFSLWVTVKNCVSYAVKNIGNCP